MSTHTRPPRKADPAPDLVRPPYRPVPAPAVLRYERRGDTLVTQASGISDAETHHIVIGLLCRMGPESARQTLHAAQHAIDDPSARLPAEAEQVRLAGMQERAVWLTAGKKP